MTAVIQHYSFPGLCCPVCFIDCESLYPHIFDVLRDWKIEKIDLDDSITPEIVMKKTIKDMVLRNFARQTPGIEILDRIYSIVNSAECYHLVYDDLDDAADLMITEFG